MKLFMHPVSTACRPVRLLIAENGINCEEELVDILKGTHYEEPYASLNPSRMVPMLEDGDLRLTESSAILKYLAEKYVLPCYPKDLKKRAKVNEMMDSAKHPVLSRLWVRADLSAVIPSPQATTNEDMQAP